LPLSSASAKPSASNSISGTWMMKNAIMRSTPRVSLSSPSARTEVMETYRRFVVLDPRLPMRLMPAGWPRERAERYS